VRAAPLLLSLAVTLTLDAPARYREAARVSKSQTLLLSLDRAPMHVPGRPDVAVHVPRGFDPGRRPGAVVYFHGWNGCVAVAVGDDDAPCTEDGPTRRASRLASQLDAAQVNAVLIALELRGDAPSGEVGELAEPSALRGILGEVFTRIEPRLGVLLDVDALDRIVVMAHSGGYQAAATVLRFGDLPRLREVVLLDALYGADEIFGAAATDRSLRVVDLYTSSAGTAERSLALADLARRSGRAVGVVEGDAEKPADDGVIRALISRSSGPDVLVQRVETPHADLPQVYTGAILSAAGFSIAP
jgi:hypothetical protein